MITDGLFLKHRFSVLITIINNLTSFSVTLTCVDKIGSGREEIPWTNRGRQLSAGKKVVFYLMLSMMYLAESSGVDLLQDENKELKQQMK